MSNHVLLWSAVSRGDKVRVIWSFLWRGLVISLASMLVSMIIGFIVGAVLGFALALMGLDVQDYTLRLQLVGFAVGAFVGMCFLVVYVNWLFSSRLGKYRLGLVPPQAAAESDGAVTAA